MRALSRYRTDWRRVRAVTLICTRAANAGRGALIVVSPPDCRHRGGRVDDKGQRRYGLRVGPGVRVTNVRVTAVASKLRG
eukprot:8991363-Pyramimonas_sp.AAC.2